jgi:hypothetical protein
MKIQQIAVFLENKPGHMYTACRTLSEAGVSIVAMSLADTQQFGILRLLVDDYDKACRVLSETGFVINTTDVLVINVVDKPGGLLHLLGLLSEGDINVEYMYTVNSRRGKNAVMVFRFDKLDGAVELLRSKDVKMLSKDDILRGGL